MEEIELPNLTRICHFYLKKPMFSCLSWMQSELEEFLVSLCIQKINIVLVLDGLYILSSPPEILWSHIHESWARWLFKCSRITSPFSLASFLVVIFPLLTVNSSKTFAAEQGTPLSIIVFSVRYWNVKEPYYFHFPSYFPLIILFPLCPVSVECIYMKSINLVSPQGLNRYIAV